MSKFIGYLMLIAVIIYALFCISTALNNVFPEDNWANEVRTY